MNMSPVSRLKKTWAKVKTAKFDILEVCDLISTWKVAFLYFIVLRQLVFSADKGSIDPGKRKRMTLKEEKINQVVD